MPNTTPENLILLCGELLTDGAPILLDGAEYQQFSMKITLPTLNEYYVGQLLYFFERACGISGYVLGVNPFNQPGVEAYKKNMFALLDKPGYEAESAAIKARL